MTIDIHGEIGIAVRSADVLSKIKKADGDETIILDIASPGGLVSESIEITDALIAYRKNGGRVEAIINPYSCSGAGLISTAADEVFIYPSSIWMAHRASVLAYGNSDYHRAVGSSLDSVDDSIIPYYMKKSGQSYFKVYDLLEKELYMEGQEIIDAGYADTLLEEETEILSHSNAKITAENAFTSMAAAYAGRYENSDRVVALKRWTSRNPDNPEIKRLVDDAIKTGKSEDDIRARLLVAERDRGGRLTGEDRGAARAVGMPLDQYRKYRVVKV